MNEYYQEFLGKSKGLSEQGLKELVSEYYGKERFVDKRNGNVYMQGFFYIRNPGKVTFYTNNPAVLGVFSLEELENLKPIK